MIEVEKLSVSKEKILSTIMSRGPSLPVQIAREINFSPLFASAFLSELKAEGKIKISNMRVGSSPLYYLPGQEEQLEKFTAYLNQREKEAFALLRSAQFLEDSEQNPVMRVALRAIKDFAVPVKVRINSESKLFWKYFPLSDSEVSQMVKSGFSGKKKILDEGKVVEKPVVKEEKKEIEKEVEQKVLPQEDERPLAEKKRVRAQESEFVINVKDFLGAKDVEVVEVFAERKKEFEAKVQIDTLFGKQIYYLFAKDKKNVSDNDLAVALQKAQMEKLPAVVMSPGELNKKGKMHLAQWGNLVKFEKLRF
ncbi:MAG: FaeA/PapI family transcriptional regulator [Nanoarchaeota archaeon]|nr:FaeA/PapI family transcriptional regulator [Nanoarchaeota archaeon]MBU1103315.1 FaeA/PapI family transcriptional regulator [Nanoarchaeota archaeon]